MSKGCQHDHDHSHKKTDHHDHAGHNVQAAPASSADGQVVRYRIDAMDCPTEETLIRNKLGRMAGIVGLEFNLMQRVLTVRHELESTEPLISAIAALGMKAEPLAATGTQTAIRIAQMDCPTEEALIRAKLSQMPGITAFEFNLMQRVVTMTHDAASLEPALAAIRGLGFEPEVQSTNADDADAKPLVIEHKPWWPLALAGLAALGAEAAEWIHLFTPWLPAALAIAAVLAAGLTTYKKAGSP